MARWECIVCGLIYDEREGWPDDGIAPGTRWEDVPEDWTCPDCGVGKADFELVPGSEEDEVGTTASGESDDAPAAATSQAASEATPEADMPSATAAVGSTSPSSAPAPALVATAQAALNTAASIVIVGSGLAGYGLARELRKLDAHTPITLVTADGGEVYSKPLLSTGYTKHLGVEQLVLQTADAIGEQLNIHVMTRTRVIGIDTEGQRLALSGNRDLHYSALVLGLGADVIRPPMGGDAASEVLSVNDLDDYALFQTAVKERNVRKVAIIGAGLIGCEFTNDLLNGGFETESVDPMGWCLPTLLPEACGRAVQSALEEKGATFHFGPLATAVNRTPNGYQVQLNNGTVIEADLVLSAVGVKPRTALAEAAGIAVGRGIKTDRYLRTSAPNVYAMGDCAEVEGHVLVYVAPLSAAARALAATLSGSETAVSYPAMPVAIKTPACPVVVSPPARGVEGAWVIEGDAPDLKATFVGTDGALLGYALTGAAVREKSALTKQLPAILP